MANPFAGKAKSSSQSKYKSMLGKSSKGQTYDGQSQSKYFGSSGNVAGGENERVGGAKSKPRADKYARGGRTRSKGTKININILGSNPQGENRALPPPLTPAALGPAAAMAPPGPSPVPGAMPGGGAPPMPPPGMKRGGRVKKQDGGSAHLKDTVSGHTYSESGARELGGLLLKDEMGRKDARKYQNIDMKEAEMTSNFVRGSAARKGRAEGGRTKMTGGAEGGVGRLEKAKAAAKG